MESCLQHERWSCPRAKARQPARRRAQCSRARSVSRGGCFRAHPVAAHACPASVTIHNSRSPSTVAESRALRCSAYAPVCAASGAHECELIRACLQGWPSRGSRQYGAAVAIAGGLCVLHRRGRASASATVQRSVRQLPSMTSFPEDWLASNRKLRCVRLLQALPCANRQACTANRTSRGRDHSMAIQSKLIGCGAPSRIA